MSVAEERGRSGSARMRKVTVDFVSETVLSFRELGPDYRWITRLDFALTGAGGPEDALGCFLLSDWYRHSFAARYSEEERSDLTIHGPYRLESITRDTFRAVSPASALTRFREWWTSQAPLAGRFEASASEFVSQGLRERHVFELQSLPASARHEWGWVVGQTGFLEYISIARDMTRLALLVGSDD